MKCKIYRPNGNNIEIFKELDLQIIPNVGDMVNFVENNILKCFTITKRFLGLDKDEPYYRIIIEYKN